MLLLTAAFFALCLAYVWWCDRIIGPDPTDSQSVSPHTSSSADAVTQTEDDEVRA
jgi:hypothetical protein